MSKFGGLKVGVAAAAALACGHALAQSGQTVKVAWIDALTGLVARPAIGADAFVEQIRGQGLKFELVLHKPDL